MVTNPPWPQKLNTFSLTLYISKNLRLLAETIPQKVAECVIETADWISHHRNHRNLILCGFYMVFALLCARIVLLIWVFPESWVAAA